MEERNKGENRARSDDYYRQRAIRRKRERAIKKRRRKIVAVGLLVLVIIIALLVTMFSCSRQLYWLGRYHGCLGVCTVSRN